MHKIFRRTSKISFLLFAETRQETADPRCGVAVGRHVRAIPPSVRALTMEKLLEGVGGERSILWKRGKRPGDIGCHPLVAFTGQRSKVAPPAIRLAGVYEEANPAGDYSSGLSSIQPFAIILRTPSMCRTRITPLYGSESPSPRTNP